MASALIHMAVAKKVNEKLNLNEKYFLLGSIAPDIGKDINIPKKISHFHNSENLPNIDMFLDKYKSYLNNPYEMGYLVHLLTDYIWFKEFITNYDKKESYVLKNGEKINIPFQLFNELLYNDYTNLNHLILDYYNIDLSVFYEEYPLPKTAITEIPEDKLRELINKMSIICSSDYTNKEYILSLENVTHFIEYATIYVLDRLEELEINN